MSGNTKNWLGIVLLVSISGSAAMASAIVYNNFGPGSGGFEYNTEEAWMVAGFYSGFYYVEQAQSFTPSQSGPLSDIYIALTTVLRVNECDVLIAPDNGAPPSPGDVLETWALHSDDVPPLMSGLTTQLTSLNQPYLAAGQNYWIWVTADQGSSVCWGMNTTGASGHMEQRQYNYELFWQDMGEQTLGALRVDVTPEPSVLAPLLLGAVAFARRR